VNGRQGLNRKFQKGHDMRELQSELVKSGLENSYEYSSGAASRAGVNAETDVTRPDI
jgi:hypothetical protein